ncbi:hypothetical protein NDU88_007105 [Pleurodeles waltl]|uniref:Uncharacterized protein n=1 Tax=Pleurodeles waltl TaxID=8319 RepID=A0AAV7NAL3_PLEWA|nr:hypothetical protein NDU88_007105 [Pleurodeles waltl]
MAECQDVPFCALPPLPRKATCGKPVGGLEASPVLCVSPRVIRSEPGCAASTGGARLGPIVRVRPGPRDGPFSLEPLEAGAPGFEGRGAFLGPPDDQSELRGPAPDGCGACGVSGVSGALLIWR